MLINNNLGRIQTNLEASRRLIEWTVELGKYDIQHQPRTTIKAQALVDFFTEILGSNSEGVCKIFVGMSASKQGSEVGVLLVSGQEDVLQLFIRLNFRALNNETEYEALLADLQATK